MNQKTKRVNKTRAAALRDMVICSNQVGSVPISGSREEMKQQMQAVREGRNVRTKAY